MIKLGICGYGNLGKGVEAAVKYNKDMELVAVFTRRNPEGVKTLSGAPVDSMDNLANYVGKIDVMVLCGGSATDLPTQTPELAKMFNVVDSFDTHANALKHFKNVEANAKANGHLGMISIGWDPGMFSLSRIYAESVLPEGADYTFWGKGVSQGHSDAIRRIEGVLDARQYTCPVDKALEAVRSGSNPELTTRQKHTRLCYVVAKEGADLARIENEIKTMPNYFSDYDTTVNFISMEELKKNHAGLPHGGFVIRTGKTGLDGEFNNTIEYSLKLDSNPHFTGSVLVAFARACYRYAKEGKTGCMTAFDVAPSYLSLMTSEELVSHVL